MPRYRQKNYYEIQLDHKQLIVVFFAVVAICIVMFLLGVMVGKGRAVAGLEVPGAQAEIAGEGAADTAESKVTAASRDAASPDKGKPARGGTAQGKKGSSGRKATPTKAAPRAVPTSPPAVKKEPKKTPRATAAVRRTPTARPGSTVRRACATPTAPPPPTVQPARCASRASVGWNIFRIRIALRHWFA